MYGNTSNSKLRINRIQMCLYWYKILRSIPKYDLVFENVCAKHDKFLGRRRPLGPFNFVLRHIRSSSLRTP